MDRHYPTLEEALFPEGLKRRGGRREGAGRKKIYHDERISVRCSKEHADLVKSFIGILDRTTDISEIRAWVDAQILK